MKNEAEAARLSLLLRAGLKDLESVVRWADGEIERVEKPAYKLIELSLIGQSKKEEAIRYLQDLSPSIEHFAALRMCLGDILEAVEKDRISCYDAAFFIHHYSDEHFKDIPDDILELWSFAENYSMARGGEYGSEECLNIQFRATLKEHIASNKPEAGNGE